MFFLVPGQVRIIYIMRKIIPVILTFSLVLAVAGGSAEPNQPGLPADSNSVKVARITCTDVVIDDALYQSIRRRTEQALEQDAEYIIYEIGTYGGLLKSADDIAKYLIQQVSLKAHTVAYVSTEAISAGALVSVSCRDIIMRRNTTIGDCAPIQPGVKLEGTEREKVETFVRAAFDRAAQANDYPQALLRAMVTMQIEVFRVKNRRTGEFQFFETDQLPDDPNTWDLENKTLLDSEDEILTLTAEDAMQYGVSRATVKNFSGALDFLAERDNVSFKPPIVLRRLWSERMVSWLNSPAVMGILIMVALFGLYTEFSTPGIGLPGLVAALCFAIIISGKYLHGMANWLEIAIFLLGIILLLIEFFLIPGFGIAGALGIIFIVAGLFGMLLRNPPEKIPWPYTEFDWRIFSGGILSIVIGLGGFAVLAWIFARFLPKLRFLSGLVLTPTPARIAPVPQPSMTSEVSGPAAGLDKGELGTALTTLRPSGRARFADAVVDVVAKAEFIDKGSTVKIIEITGNRVIVQAVKEEGSEY